MKLNKCYIIIGLIIIPHLIFVFWGYNWLLKCNHTMDMLGSALSSQNIILMDELFSPDCSVITTEGRTRKYSYQRGVIEKIWNKSDYQVISYDYDQLGFYIEYWLAPTIQYTFEMRILDSEGNEYELSSILIIHKKFFFECEIISINSGVNRINSV